MKHDKVVYMNDSHITYTDIKEHIRLHFQDRLTWSSTCKKHLDRAYDS